MDKITQYLRCHVEYQSEEKTESGWSPKIDKLAKEIHPYQNYVFVFDTETSTDTAQQLRFGTWEVHGLSKDEIIRRKRNETFRVSDLDTLIERGIFYEESALSLAEIETIQQFAKTYNLKCVSKERFVHIFYEWVWREKALLIGHNLVFDLSRLATEVHASKEDYEGGFSIRLCSCTWKNQNDKQSCFKHPRIRIKTIATHKHLIGFAKVSGQYSNGSPINGGYQGKFIDTAGVARALLGPGGVSLEKLGDTLKIEHPKRTTYADGRPIEHGAPLTLEYLDYCLDDTRATFEVYQKLRSLYQEHGRSQALHWILSEASLGKAYFKDMGVSPPMERMGNIPPEVHGAAMSGFYAGRSEIHIRRKVVEVAYADFKSQYPTVFALMGLQDLLLAERYEIVDRTAEVKNILASFEVKQLQDKAFWKRLRIIVKIKGSGLIVPMRADYGSSGRNIALPSADIPPTWYTLCDALSNLLFGGAMPEVVEAFEVVPIGRIKTSSLNLFGDSRYRINLDEQDFFIELINLRSRIKKLYKNTGDEYYYRLQLALKLIANATSYGILVEVTQKQQKTNKEIVVYGNEGGYTHNIDVLEEAGKYYCPPIGVHIPAGGRLMLAIAERLAADRGLSYALCDTDSMAFAKPDNMDSEEFNKLVQEIIVWFTPLSPYETGVPIFEMEDVNFWGKDSITGEPMPEPLFCVAISAKRYCLYNRKPDGTFRLRTGKGHGTGLWMTPSDYQSPDDIPEPEGKLSDIVSTEYGRWIYDLWYAFIRAIEAGHPDKLDLPSLDYPAFHQLTITSWELFQIYRKLPGMRPFNFITVLPQLNWMAGINRKVAAQLDENEKGSILDYMLAEQAAMYAPYTRDIRSVTTFYSMKTQQALPNIRPMTMEEAIQGYFNHPEFKAANGSDDGEMQRREVKVVQQISQGKETNNSLLTWASDVDDTAILDLAELTHEQQDIPYEQGKSTVAFVKGLPIRRFAEAGLKPYRLKDMRKGKRPSLADSEILEKVGKEQSTWLKLRDKIIKIGINQASRITGLAPYTLSRMCKRDYSPDAATLALLNKALGKS